MIVTEEFLEMAKPDSGSFNKDQIELFGVEWDEYRREKMRKNPWFKPPRDWKKILIGKEISDEIAAQIVHLGGLNRYGRNKLKARTALPSTA